MRLEENISDKFEKVLSVLFLNLRLVEKRGEVEIVVLRKRRMKELTRIFCLLEPKALLLLLPNSIFVGELSGSSEASRETSSSSSSSIPSELLK